MIASRIPSVSPAAPSLTSSSARRSARLGRVVALKFLLPHYNLDASAKARFLREAHAAAALDHPNLCTIHEVGASDEGWLFLAMALYHGETLRARLTRD
ncbi:MAG: hypothetical protein DMD63_15945, partial [Gemmatimonadetes bacterium]